MYKRHVLGTPESETGTLGGVVALLALCSMLVWTVPLVMEAVSGMPIELFMVPPIWRGEIMCGAEGDGEREYTYRYEDGECVKVCRMPGCGVEGESAPAHSREVWEDNLRKARSGLDLYGIFGLALAVLRYGSVLAALGSLGMMRISGRPAWSWACVPCGAGAVAAILEPALLPVGLASLAAAYGSDIWSTARFGERAVRAHEANPLMRGLFRLYAMRTALALHTAIYAVLIACATYLLAHAGPLQWDALLAAAAFALAGMHVWVACNNTQVYRELEAGADGR